MEWWEPFIRIAAAAVYAGVIGIDRELRAKPAGLRTNIVVGIAAAAFGYISETAFETVRGYDPSRVASEVVTGVGFLGAGAIFASGGKPAGLTTAAALWGSAAAGLSAGVGALFTGAAVAVVTLVALQPLDWLARTLLGTRRREDRDLHLVVRDLAAAHEIRRVLRDVGLRVPQLEMWPFGDEITLQLTLHGTRPQLHRALEQISQRSDVSFISEISVPAGER